ncbi:hypothetical protein [Mobilicoccus caccae]|uniref:hypothetical protein n=1 Tax=Mobilicoccus caccae TaxID=1859295 RepID=UPI0024E14356|nr:hypothetical protein [Mobilicoccus caccae]
MSGSSGSRRLARRARTIVATGRHLEIGVLSGRRVVDRHLVEMDGSILCGAESVAGNCFEALLRGAPSPEIHLEAVDVSSVPQPDRQRGSVWARGRVELVTRPLPVPMRSMLGLTCVEPVLRFRPESVTVREGMYGQTAPVPIDIGVYRDECEDRLAGWEGAWLTHLDAGHADAVRWLAATRMTLRPEARVHPLLVDEEGVVLRVYQDGTITDLRLGFPWPALCGCSAVAAFDALLVELRA